MGMMEQTRRGAEWAHKHPTTAFFCVSALTAFLSYGGFHSAGDHSTQRAEDLVGAGQATTTSMTYEGHSIQSADEARVDYEHGAVRKGYLQLALAQIEAQDALAQSELASHDALLADQQLGDRQNDAEVAVVMVLVSGVSLTLSGYNAIQVYNRRTPRGF
jgi:hypothetical protein